MRYLIILFCFYYNILYSQINYDKNWVLGYSSTQSGDNTTGVKIEFLKDSLIFTKMKTELFVAQSNVAMSDSLGNLQFYSGGCAIYNSQNKLIVNGDSIGLGKYKLSYCDSEGSGRIPLTQMLFTVPNLRKKGIYNIFYLNLADVYTNSNGFPLSPTQLYHSEIDMNDGFGKISKKNQLILSDTFARAMLQGVLHKNSKDWWIVMPKSQSNCYQIVRFNSDGTYQIKKTCDGMKWTDKDTKGQAVFSPNRKFYARLGHENGLSIFNFNNSTGDLNLKQFIPITDTFYTSGLAFSPNSRFLYTMCNQKIYQYDMKAQDIEKSKILIAKSEKSNKSIYKIPFGQSMLAPNGKIYIAGEATHDYLHVINQPNLLGNLCQFHQYGINIQCLNSYGLPNMPHLREWKEDTTTLTSMLLEQNNMSITANIYPNPASYDLNLDLFGYVNNYQKGKYIISDLQGRPIATYPLLPNHDEYRFDISQIQNGIHLWQLILDDKVRQSGKVVVLKE